jgi:hypothetical protein
MDRAEGALEILDRPVALADRVASLADIDRLNAWFGGYALTLREIRRVVAALPGGDALVAVDVGGGHAAFAVRLVEWARGARRAIRVVVVDRDAETLALARRACAAYPEIRLVVADATALPLREGAADVVTCALTLHHLEPDAAVASLREMAAAARRAVIVNDLLRGHLALGLVWLATRLLRCHPISRHDGPLSVRRAYSAAELAALAQKAGITTLTVRVYPLYGRLVAVAA